MLKINPSKRSDFFKFFISKKFKLNFELSDSDVSELNSFYAKISKTPAIELIGQFDCVFDYKRTVEMAEFMNKEVEAVKWHPLDHELLAAFLYTNTIFVNLCKKQSSFETLRSLFLAQFEKIKPEIQEYNSLKSKKSENPSLPPPVPGITTRFPPEPSGYLHIGHAKAALLNQYYGTKMLRVRFDDTNQNKEYQLYENIILEDLKLLGITDFVLSRTSDYFGEITMLARKLIELGKAYCDDTPVDVMRAERDKGIESRHRNVGVEENLRIFDQILKLRELLTNDQEEENGKVDEKDQSRNTDYSRSTLNKTDLLKFCIRAKIDFQNVNKALRDPVIMRINMIPHHKTKTKYILYPTYDFACPIADNLEHVDLVLRTNEFRDRNDQYFWFLETLKLRKPKIFDFSRLNFKNTILSKRKLRYFVENKMVSGWDDPRLPTIRGIVRLGLTVEALKEYVILQGANQKVSVASVDKLWAINKKVVDERAPRYSIVDEDFVQLKVVNNCDDCKDAVKGDGHAKNGEDVISKIKNMSLVTPLSEELILPLHKKNPKIGTKKVFTTDIIISRSDANSLSENQTFTLLNIGNMDVLKIGEKEIVVKKSASKDYKDTVKISWISKRCAKFIKIIEYSDLSNGNEIEDFNYDSKKEAFYLAESCVDSKKGDVVQFERFGFCYCDDSGVYHLIPYTMQRKN